MVPSRLIAFPAALAAALTFFVAAAEPHQAQQVVALEYPSSSGIRYRCNLSEYDFPPAPSAASSAAAALVETVSLVLASLSSSTYTHFSSMSYEHGIYRTDCSCLISYILNAAPASQPGSLALYFEDVPKDDSPTVAPPMPRAGQYVGFFQTLLRQRQAHSRWKAVASVLDIQRGDLIGWSIPSRGSPSDTGHIVVAMTSSQPSDVMQSSYPSVWLQVFDASQSRHEDDTRCDSRSCHPGLGTGSILLFYDPVDGSPVAFKFHAQATFRDYPIAMARLL
ncbi:uncharacterized protein BJ171DRAFT_578782 [Polychytrium aggregatum]|uniref:uncharacterized protein n=1 Tax=Polychytrium aggregatum TaxID=110093 RepID=UPI0022FE76C0|nr:uncharacterized protein BJ171DRAFT_578782 [Polychytrium aggregatum]KAI9207676.1 hypothetical protein BJ171DRAFT_578782 [Polychytrium aggregatum]